MASSTRYLVVNFLLHSYNVSTGHCHVRVCKKGVVSMAVYKVSDLLSKLLEVSDDGYTLVEITELEAEDDYPESLSFAAVSDYECVDYEDVSSVSETDIESSNSFDASDFFPISFTFDEIDAIKYSIDNTLENLKLLMKSSNCSRDSFDNMKAASVACRNLQAKLSHRLKDFE